MTAFKTLVSAAALGAAAMFVLDPDRGRRRRALARDKARRFAYRSSDLVAAARRDAAHRIHALRAKARRLMARDGDASDEVLVERVRARLGRVVAHPHAVRVSARRGRVQLSGPILRREHALLLATVRRVRGVVDVNGEALALYDRSDGVSALQGDVRRNGTRPELLQAHWTPALRLCAIGGGGLLALMGVRCAGVSRLALTAAGVALAARGAVNVPFGRMLGLPRDTRDAQPSRGSSPFADNGETADDWLQAAADTPRASAGA